MPLGAFLSYLFVTTFSPGPNNILAMSNAQRHGYKKTLKFIFGIISGFAIIMLISSFLNVLLARFLPTIMPVMRIIGGLYMLYIAYKILRHTSSQKNESNDIINTYKAGFIMQFANFKVILYGITVTSLFIIPYYQSSIILIGFSLLLTFAGFLSTLTWALLGAVFQKYLQKYEKPFNLIMAGLIFYSAVMIWLH